MVVIEEGVKDVIKSASRNARGIVNKVKNTYDYLNGTRNSRHNFVDEATESELSLTDFKPYIGTFKYNAKIDDDERFIQLTFDAREVGKDFADHVRPDNKSSDSLYPYVVNYNDHIVTMELPINAPEEESVMTPTPVPYKGYRCDKDGKLLKEDDLEETPGLRMSSPKIVYDGEKDFEGHLEIEINGKTYKYQMKQGTNKLPTEIAGTVSSMQKFSDGKALAYLKKNMTLIKEELGDTVNSKYVVVDDFDSEGDSSEDVCLSRDQLKETRNLFKSHHICQGCGNPLSQCTCDVQEEDIDLDSLEESSRWMSTDEISSELDTVDEKHNDILLNDKESSEMYRLGYTLGTSSKGDFIKASKDDYAQYISGKDVNGDDIVRDNSGEVRKVFLKDATQPSNIGQHKSDSIDLVEDEKDIQKECKS